VSVLWWGDSEYIIVDVSECMTVGCHGVYDGRMSVSV